MNTAPARWFVAQFKCKRISAFVSKRRLIFIRIYDSALLIEIFRAYMQVAGECRQRNAQAK